MHLTGMTTSAPSCPIMQPFAWSYCQDLHYAHGTFACLKLLLCTFTLQLLVGDRHKKNKYLQTFICLCQGVVAGIQSPISVVRSLQFRKMSKLKLQQRGMMESINVVMKNWWAVMITGFSCWTILCCGLNTVEFMMMFLPFLIWISKTSYSCTWNADFY